MRDALLLDPRVERCGMNSLYAQCLYWSICKDHDLKITDKWYQHTPVTAMHNKHNNLTIMWDMPVSTDRTITANRPDIIVKDSVNSTCKLIDMTVSHQIETSHWRKSKGKKVQRPRTINTENVAYENHSDPCSCWCKRLMSNFIIHL